MNRILVGFLSVLAAALLPAAGQGIVNPLGSTNSVSLPILLPGGITGDVTVNFESVTGLTPANLGVTTQLVSLLDPLLSGRLPPLTSLLASFPVLVRIEPTLAGNLSFTGVASIQIHTPPLLPNMQRNMRVAAASQGGPYEDITTSSNPASGIRWDTSYRVIGTKGGFSEFLVLIDLTPPAQAVGAKLNRLDQIFAANAGAIPETIRANLAADLAAARAHSLAGDEAAALQDLDLFIDTVEQHSGTEIPDVWSAARDRINVAGLLRAAAETLQFSLRLQQSLGG